MEFIIKIATINDLAVIQELNLKLFEKEYTEFDDTLDCGWTFGEDGESYFKKHITEDDSCVFVAFIHNLVIGYLAGGLAEKDPSRVLPKFAELESMFVLDEYRGQGVGKKLYETFVDWCKQKGVGRLRVIASCQNISGINFYRKNSFLDYDLILETKI